MCNGYKNGQGGLLSRHRGRGLEPLHLHAQEVRGDNSPQRRDTLHRLQRRAPRPPQLHGRRHVHARDAGHPLRRALRALPQRARRGERHNLRRAAGHAGRHALSRGPRRQDARAARGDHALLDVQAAHHKRGHNAGRGPHRLREPQGHPGPGRGVHRRRPAHGHLRGCRAPHRARRRFIGGL